MTSFKPILNLLTLLKEPKGIQELYDSGCFYGWKHLRKTVRICLKAGLIEIEYVGREKLDVEQVMSHSLHKRRWHKAFNYLLITSLGVTFLSCYIDWQVKKAIRKERVDIILQH